MTPKRLVFLGNRPSVLRAVRDIVELPLAHVFALEGSPIFTALDGLACPVTRFSKRDKAAAIDALLAMEFDALLSAGTPFILPASRLAAGGRALFNVHPSLLPDLRGMHPANGALLFGRAETGATLHYLDDGIDTGPIVLQRSFPIPPELDLAGLYRKLFDLEAEVARDGLRRWIDSGFRYGGEPQQGPSTYYTRRDTDMRVDFAAMDREEILRRVRAFGIAGQGVAAEVEGRAVRIYAAERAEGPGEGCVRALDGWVRLTRRAAS